jgi:DNA-dependent protein kinase catalytic subunit
MMHHTSRDIEAQLSKIESSMPEDILLSSVRKLCASPEAFLTVRQRFSTSFAALSVGAYILGIGDRHLDNFMFLKSTGQVAAIDFGAAFGVGLNMPVPELMPIRLTRQLRSFLRPLDTTGLLKHDMVHALSALRERQDMLLPVMSVFVNEPVAEWSDASRNYRDQTSGLAQTDPEGWFPKKKIKIAQMKLQGTSSRLSIFISFTIVAFIFGF